MERRAKLSLRVHLWTHRLRNWLSVRRAWRRGARRRSPPYKRQRRSGMLPREPFDDATVRVDFGGSL